MKKSSRCVFVLNVGSKYQRHFRAVKNHFQTFAAFNDAVLHIQETPIDPEMRHDLMVQKILVPDRMREYEHILMVDSDIFFSDMKGVFDAIINLNVDCAAANMQINSSAYEVLCEFWGLNNVKSIDELRNEATPINGGVIYFNSFKCANIMRNYYFSQDICLDLKKNGFNREEGIILKMANEGEIKFSPLQRKYNDQVLWKMAENSYELLQRHRGWRGKALRFFDRLGFYNEFITSNWYGKDYLKLVQDCCERSSIVHFAGGLPYPYKLVRKLEK